MSHSSKLIYASPNGDRWFLLPDHETGFGIVRHEANEPSGGAISEMGVDAFLAQIPRGPQHTELARILQDTAKRQTDESP